MANFPGQFVKLSTFWNSVGYVFSLLMIVSLLLPLANVIKSLVEEKETRMRETMYMMGLRSDALWLAWAGTVCRLSSALAHLAASRK